MSTKQTAAEILDKAAGYEKLAAVFMAAFAQASNGKGKERHASEGVPSELQPMSTINMEQGSIDGFLYQARKKALESKRLPPGRAQAELLGAIVYLAGAVIALDTWAAHTLPGHEAMAKKLPEKAEQSDADGWIEWGGGACPVPRGTPVEVKFHGTFEAFQSDVIGHIQPRFSITVFQITIRLFPRMNLL